MISRRPLRDVHRRIHDRVYFIGTKNIYVFFFCFSLVGQTVTRKPNEQNGPVFYTVPQWRQAIIEFGHGDDSHARRLRGGGDDYNGRAADTRIYIH